MAIDTVMRWFFRRMHCRSVMKMYYLLVSTHGVTISKNVFCLDEEAEYFAKRNTSIKIFRKNSVLLFSSKWRLIG